MAILHNRFEKTKTVGDVFGIFLDLAKKYPSSAEASRLFQEYVDKISRDRGCAQADAEAIARANISYYAGYYDKRTQNLIWNAYYQSLGRRK